MAKGGRVRRRQSQKREEKRLVARGTWREISGERYVMRGTWREMSEEKWREWRETEMCIVTGKVAEM